MTFSDTLTAEQRAALHRPYSFRDARRWSNYPEGSLGGAGRVGLRTGTLDPLQWRALEDLLRAATGTGRNAGFDEIQQHLRTDDWVHEHGDGEASWYGRGRFSVAFLGAPSDSGRWELQFGGHHLAVSNTYLDGVLVGATPSFRGIEPFRAIEQGGATNDAGRRMQRALSAVLGSLDRGQLAVARLAGRHDDLLLGPGEDWRFPAGSQGLRASAMDPRQRALLVAAVGTFVDAVDDASAERILAGYAAELDDTRVAFAGTPRLDRLGDYVRVDGPGVWIELSMRFPVVAPGTHPHAVWRDRRTDYGGVRA